MGSYVEEKEYERWNMVHGGAYDLKTVCVQKLFGIPYLWIKKSVYRKEYSLFNCIPIYTVTDYSGRFVVEQ